MIKHRGLFTSPRGDGVQIGATTGSGVRVTQVRPARPAATAGIKAGDVITAVNGTATPDPG